MKRCLNCMEEYGDNLLHCPVCGFQEEMQDPGVNLPVGSILSARYIVGTCQKIRQTDIIYIGWDELFHRKVLIQEFFPSYCLGVRVNKETVSIFDSKKEIFEQGLRQFVSSGKKLLWCYNEEDIVTVHSCFEENDTAYLIMEYRELETLKEWLGEDTLNIRSALLLFDRAINAVKKVHCLGLYHGQISLDSFWISGGRYLILKDFGPGLYVSGKPGGLDYQNAGPWTDVYGLASMLCQILTGSEISQGTKVDCVLADYRISKKINIVQALRNALEEAPSLRTNSVGELEWQIFGKGKKKRSKAAMKKNKTADSLKLSVRFRFGAVAVLSFIIILTILFSTGIIKGKNRPVAWYETSQEGEVPNVLNMRWKEIADFEKKSGWEVCIWGVNEDHAVDKGIVVSQFPDARTIQNKKKIYVTMQSESVFVKVPQAVGMKQEEAKRLFTEAGLRTEVKNSEDMAEPGTVTAQSLESESSVSLGNKVILSVSSGEEKNGEEIETEVPDVQGKVLEDARKILEEQGFYLVQVGAEYSDLVSKGEIVSQKPEAGEIMIQKSNIYVSISRGKEQVKVPEIVFLSSEEARDVLETLFLTLEKTEAYSISVEKGKIIKQEPEAGSVVEKGSKVKATVSLGSKPKETKGPEKSQKSENRRGSSKKESNAVTPTKGSPPKSEENQSQPTKGELNNKPDETTAITEASESGSSENNMDTQAGLKQGEPESEEGTLPSAEKFVEPTTAAAGLGQVSKTPTQPMPDQETTALTEAPE